MSRIRVSKGRIPYLKKEDAKLFLEDMKKSKLKSEMFKDCGKKLQKILDELGL